MTRRSFISVDVTFFESTPYYFKDKTVSEVSSISIPVPLPSSVSPLDLIFELSLCPLQVYTRRRQVLSTKPSTTLDGSADPSSLPAAPTLPLLTQSDGDLPIALCKGKQSCTAHPLANSLFYEHLSPSFRTFAISLSSSFVPRSYHEAVLHPE